MPYFNGFAIGVFAVVALTMASGMILTRASSERMARPAAAHQTTAADLGYARAVSWISTSHVSR